MRPSGQRLFLHLGADQHLANSTAVPCYNGPVCLQSRECVVGAADVLHIGKLVAHFTAIVAGVVAPPPCYNGPVAPERCESSRCRVHVLEVLEAMLDVGAVASCCRLPPCHHQAALHHPSPPSAETLAILRASLEQQRKEVELLGGGEGAPSANADGAVSSSGDKNAVAASVINRALETLRREGFA